MVSDEWIIQGGNGADLVSVIEEVTSCEALNSQTDIHNNESV